jgi:N-sulfoglucosamine sulfohydrolase
MIYPIKISNRNLKSVSLLVAGALVCIILAAFSSKEQPSDRPNVLFVITDDQSWLHTSVMGAPQLTTPGFDRVASQGILFQNAYCSAPSCAPSRASILTGRPIYDLKEGGLLFGRIPREFDLFSDLLLKNGYDVGYTGKVYGPGKMDGENQWNEEEIMGKEYMMHQMKASEEVGPFDYARNFRKFLKDHRKKGNPFFFWCGAFEPHRDFDRGIGAQNGIDPDSVKVPGFLPDNKVIRNDIADYLFEIQWFDEHLVRMINILEKSGELENTLIIVTSDNGMPFPRAKANLYEYGTHMPLAIMWGDRIKGGRRVDDFVGAIDFAPTILDLAGVNIPEAVCGKSLRNILESDEEGLVDPERDKIITAIERHTYCRPGGLPYPVRALRKGNWTYLVNFEPERYPAGHPRFKAAHGLTYGDVDGGPSREYMIQHKEDPEMTELFELAFGKRPGEELYDISKDPYQMNNLANDPTFTSIKEELREELFTYLRETGDPRMKGESPWDHYPYYLDEYEKRAQLPVDVRDTLIDGFMQ